MKYFLDTNCFIHYQLFTEIDWKNVLHDDVVILVVCPTVIKELDQKKFTEQDINIRKRCQLVIKKLSEFVENNKTKNDAEMMFITSEPCIDWANENLCSDIPDDRIIASVLCQGNIEESCIITSDLGLALKAKIKGIRTFELGHELYLELNDDKKEKEIKRLNEKINRLESKNPILKLLINSNSIHSEFVKFQIKDGVPYSREKIESEITKEAGLLTYVKPTIDRTSIAGTLGSFRIPDEKEIKRFEEETKEYIPKLREYYINENKRINCLLRTYKLIFCLDNNGTVPAEDVDVFMHFPDGFELLKDKIYSHELKRPERPLKPQTAAEMLRNLSIYPGYSLGDMHVNHSPSATTLPNSYISSFKKTHSYEVEFHIQRLKHNLSIDLKPLYVFFNSFEEIKSFSVNYKISIGNHPEVSSGELNIIFA